MIGHVGTVFGAHGINIISAHVGLAPEDENGRPERMAAMAVTTDVPVPGEVLSEVLEHEGFADGRTVSLH